MADDAINPSRRGLLQIFAVAGAGLAPASSAEANERWADALEKYRAAEAAWRAAGIAAAEAQARFDAGAPDPGDFIDWTYPGFRHLDRDVVAHDFDVVRHLRQIEAACGLLWGPGQHAARAEHARAACEGVARYRAALAAHAEACGLDAAMDEEDRLYALMHEAEAALLATPAPDLAALAWKGRHLLDAAPDQPFTAGLRTDCVRPFLDDLNRLGAAA